MPRWKCNNPRCGVVVETVNHLEDALPRIDAAASSECPICNRRDGFENLDYKNNLLESGILKDHFDA